VISKIFSFDWVLWFFWIMATTLGWLLGRFILPGISLVVSGFLISVFQWLVLQGRIHRSWRWVIATTIGWTSGYFLAFLLLPEGFEGLIIGFTTGSAQWMIMRKEVSWAGWWIVFSVMGWITGLTLLPGILSTGAMAGALIGFCLEILFRSPRKSLPNRSPM
jgi:hypothetical protein